MICIFDGFTERKSVPTQLTERTIKSVEPTEKSKDKGFYRDCNIVCSWCGWEKQSDRFGNDRSFRKGSHAMNCPRCGKVFNLSSPISFDDYMNGHGQKNGWNGLA